MGAKKIKKETLLIISLLFLTAWIPLKKDLIQEKIDESKHTTQCLSPPPISFKKQIIHDDGKTYEVIWNGKEMKMREIKPWREIKIKLPYAIAIGLIFFVIGIILGNLLG